MFCNFKNGVINETIGFINIATNNGLRFVSCLAHNLPFFYMVLGGGGGKAVPQAMGSVVPMIHHQACDILLNEQGDGFVGYTVGAQGMGFREAAE